MKRILLTIAYDGTNYSGWQKQKDEAVITVEGELTKALRLLFRNPALECIGASRTDAGVHALGQRAVIDVETSIPAEKIPLAIRSFLPADIVVTKAEEVAETFHPRFDCVKKRTNIVSGMRLRRIRRNGSIPPMCRSRWMWSG